MTKSGEFVYEKEGWDKETEWEWARERKQWLQQVEEMNRVLRPPTQRQVDFLLGLMTVLTSDHPTPTGGRL